jgi:hypothetical protein
MPVRWDLLKSTRFRLRRRVSMGLTRSIRKKVKFDREAVLEPLPGNLEIKSASLHYRKRVVKPR